MKKIVFLLCLCQSLCWATESVEHIKIVSENALIYTNPFEKSQPIYQTKKESVFKVNLDQDAYYQVLSNSKEIGWIKKNQAEPTVVDKNDDLKPVIELYNKPEKVKKKTEKDYYQNVGQEDYRFPKRDAPQEFNIDLDGYFQIKISGRDFSPNNPTNPIYQTILNDPLYSKVPREIRLGQLRKEFRSKINIEGKLAEDLFVYYNITQEPDTPDVYDVQIKYKSQDFKFFNFDSSFKSGEFLSVSKALRGAYYKYNSPNRDVKLAMGKQRSTPQVMQGFGTGQKTMKLNHGYVFEDSVFVFVNQKKLTLNKDYTVNYFEGEIKFVSPPQQNDSYKIIYEYSNPIADYIPILARKNFFGIHYKQDAEGKSIEKDKIKSSSETFKLNVESLFGVNNLDQFRLITKDQIQSELDVEDKESQKLIKFLQKINVLNQNNLLQDWYNPDVDNDLFKGGNPLPTHISELRTLVDTVYAKYKKEIQIQSEKDIKFSKIQLKPVHLLAVDLIEKEDAEAIWKDLVANQMLDSNGYVREDIYFIENVLATSSEYSLHFNDVITPFVKDFFIKKYNFEDEFVFKLKHNYLVLGSESVFINKLKLTADEDYYIDYDKGKLSLNFMLFPKDEISINYNYYETKTKEEDLIGKNSLGPYQLKNQSILDNSVTVLLNNKELTETRDYIIDYDEGKLYFNYKVLYPSLIFIKYKHKEKELIKEKLLNRAVNFDLTYVEENLPSDQEESIIRVTSENISVDENHVLQLFNNPIELSESFTISVQTQGSSQHIVVPSSDYTIVDAYQGLIEITGQAYQGYNTFYTSYSYLKSYDTYAYISATGQPQVNSNDFSSFNNIPVKYDGVKYITYWNDGIETYLENGTEFTVDYLDDGQTIQINFILNSIETPTSELYSYPGAQDQLKLVYKYIPNSIISLDNVFQRMAVGRFDTKLTDSIKIEGEIAMGSDNYSNIQLEGKIESMPGTGKDNDRYFLGFPNIVEDSEQIVVNGIVRSQAEDYFINYKTGYFFFKSFTPGPDDVIQAEFKYYESGGALVSGNPETAFATKFKTTYRTPSYNITNQVKLIQDDFKPIGSIQETAGSSVINTGVVWNINKKNNFNMSHTYRKVFAGSNEIDIKKYTRQHTLSSSLSSKILDVIDSSQSFNYDLNVQDPFKDYLGENNRNIDTLTLSYNGTFKWNTEHISNSYVRKYNQRISDYIDRENESITKTFSDSFNSSLNYKSFPILGSLILNPSYYSSISRTESNSESQFLEDKRKNFDINGDINPLKNLNIKGSYSKVNSQKKTIDETTYDQGAINFGMGSVYKPASWLSTSYRYSQDEKESALLDTKGDLSTKQSVDISTFLPYSALRSAGMPPDFILIRPFKKTSMKLSSSSVESKKNDHRKLNFTETNKLSLNVINLTPGLSINNLVYNVHDSNYTNLVQTNSVSENYVITSRLDYTGSINFKPKIKWLKNIEYSYLKSHQTADSDTQTLARDVSGNIVLSNQYVDKDSHTFKYKLPRFRIKHPFKKRKKIRVGSFNINSKYIAEIDTNLETKDTMVFNQQSNNYDNTQDNYYLSNDSKQLKRLELTGNINPLNILNFNFQITSSNVLLDRNKFNVTGTTAKDQLDYKVSTSFSPLSRLSLTVAISDQTLEQYRAPTINVSLADIITAKDSNDSTGFSDYINKLSRGYSGSATLRLTKKLNVTAQYVLNKIEESLETLTNSSLDNIDIKTLNYTVTFEPIKKSSLSYTLSENNFSQKKNNISSLETGTQYTLNAKYKPIRTAKYNVDLSYSRVGSKGYGLNIIEQTNSLTGDGDYIQTQLGEVDNFTESGTLTVNIKYPLVNLKYADNLTISGEGYIKKINDNLKQSNNYNISALLIKAELNF